MNIQLSNSDKTTIVDQEVATLLEGKKIYLTNSGYAQFRENGKNIYVHRYVFQHFNPEVNIDKLNIDHINQNKLDNQISNLRIASRSLNNLNKSKSNNNTSGIKNVCYSNSNKRWKFQITLNDKKYVRVKYSSKSEALFALKYLVNIVANEQEKQFLCLDENENFDEISDTRKEIIKADLDNYIERLNNNIYKPLKIKSDKTYIYKYRNKYKIEITIFNKLYRFGTYETLEDAKSKRDLLVEIFNEYNGENMDAVETIIKNTFESEIIRQNIYRILNKKINAFK